MCRIFHFRFYFVFIIGYIFYFSLTLKRLGEGGDQLWFFLAVFSIERIKPRFFVTYNIIISHIFHENFIEIPQVIHKIQRFYPSILIISISFLNFYGQVDSAETAENCGIRGNFAFPHKTNIHLPLQSLSMVLTLI